MSEQIRAGETVTVDGDTWHVLTVGRTAERETFVHLASTTRTIRQRNGARPVQCCGWISEDRKTLRGL